MDVTNGQMGVGIKVNGKIIRYLGTVRIFFLLRIGKYCWMDGR